MDFRAFDIDAFQKTIDERGYVRIYVGEGEHPHSNKGYIYAHRAVMESSVGRFLDPSEVVHHINEIKTDNRLENLFLCSAEEHAAIHNRGRVFSLERKGNIARGVNRHNRGKNRKMKGEEG